MAGFLLDTNHLSHAIRTVSALRDRLRESHRHGFRIGTCWPALCELEAGICQSHDPQARRRTLRQVLQEVRIWPIEWPTVRLYGELWQEAKRNGRVLAHVDVVLAAMATQQSLTVLTSDKDFEAFPKLRTENWLD
jgi:tRNA(fMet)-specific endonuclease VapC